MILEQETIDLIWLKLLDATARPQYKLTRKVTRDDRLLRAAARKRRWSDRLVRKMAGDSGWRVE